MTKKLHIGPYELLMLALVAGAVLLRFILIHAGWPITNSDEATMDLMALHIGYRGEHPIFFYGQYYMGSLEAYIGAFLFHWLGISIFAVRIGLLPFFALFLFSMYALTRLLYTRVLALITVLLLSLGSSNVIIMQLMANGGYPEIVFFGACIFFLTFWLALSSQTSTQRQSPHRWRRAAGYGLWGFFVGLALWTDQLILPCLLTSSIALFLFCRHELRHRLWLFLLLGFVVGAFPLLLHNLTSPIEQNSLVVLFSVQQGGNADIALHHIPYVQRLLGAFLVSLPSATGMYPTCYVAEPLPAVQQLGTLFTSANPVQCALSQGSWSLGILLLWLAATFLCLRPLQKLGHLVLFNTWTYREDSERRVVILQTARLLLLVSAALTFVLFALSPIAAIHPRTSARYLICLSLSAPALLWPLWEGTSLIMQTLSRTFQSKAERLSLPWLVRTEVLLFITIILLQGTLQTVADIPSAQAAFRQQDALTQDLLRLGARRIYSDYWTCNRLIFHSQERIICSALSEQLEPAQDRYAPYHMLVKSTAQPTYVFPVTSQQAKALSTRLEHSRRLYQRLVLDGYVIYSPR